MLKSNQPSVIIFVFVVPFLFAQIFVLLKGISKYCTKYNEKCIMAPCLRMCTDYQLLYSLQPSANVKKKKVFY